MIVKNLMRIVVLAICLVVVSGCETTSINPPLQSKANALDLAVNAQIPEVAAFEFKDIPSLMLFIPATSGSSTIESADSQFDELYTLIPENPSPDFFYNEVNEGVLVYNNVAGKFAFNVDEQESPGIIYSDGIRAPSYVYLNSDTTFLQEFIEYFSIDNKVKFEKYIERRAKKSHRDAMRKSEAENPIQRVLETIKTDLLPDINSEQAAKVNDVILGRFDFIYGYHFNERFFTGDFKSLDVEIIEGDWKGRTYSFKRNELGQRISSQNVIYDGTNTTNTEISYNSSGLISKISSSNYRSKHDSQSDTTLYLFWESATRVLVYRFYSSPDKPVYWDDMESILVEKFEFDTQYRPVSHQLYTYNGVTEATEQSTFGWVWSYKPNEIAHQNIRDGKPFDQRVSKYKNGVLVEEIFESFDGSYFRKQLNDDLVSKSYSREGELLETVARTADGNGCLSNLVKSNEGKISQRIKLTCK